MKRLLLSRFFFSLGGFSLLHAGPVEVGFSFAPGYRSDSMHWTVTSSSPLNEVLEEKWRNLQIVQLAGKVDLTLIQHLYLRIEGDYGWVLSGNKTYDLDVIGTSTGDEWLRASVNGYVYDVSGCVGYLASFFSNQFQAMPLLGCSYSVQHFKDDHYIDKIYLLNLFEDVASVSTYQWLGPWLGLSLEYLNQYIKTSIEYQFHWSFYKSKVQDNLIDTEVEHQKKNCAYGNNFILRLFSPEWRRWSVGLIGQYEFYNGTNGSSKIGAQKSTLNGIHWTSGSISLSVMRSF